MDNSSEIRRNRLGSFSSGTGAPSPSSSFKDVAGPSDSELVDIEKGSNAASAAGAFYTPEEIEKVRSQFAHIDPEYSALRNAREGRKATFDVPSSRIGDFSSGEVARSTKADAKAQADLMGDVADIQKTGEVGAGEGSATTAYDDESTGRGRRFPAAKMGAFEEAPGLRESPFTRIKEGSDVARKQLMGAGLLMLREAGRCDSPGCQLLRATGMQLTGQTQRSASVKPAESNAPAIPAVHTEKSFYPTDPVTGKQNRKNPQTIIESKPANPKSPEWQEAQGSLDTSGPNIFFPEDALEHKHDDEVAHLAYVKKRIAGFGSHVGDYND